MFRNHLAGAALAAMALLFAPPLQAQEAAVPAVSGESAAKPQSEPQPEPQRRPSKQKDFATLTRESEQALKDKNWVLFYVSNMKLHEQRPFEPEYLYNVIRACAMLDRKSTAYHYMLMLQKQGLHYDFNELEDSQNIRGTEAYDYINNMLIEAGIPAGTGSVVFTLPGDSVDYQAMAWDGSRNGFFVGTMEEGALYSVDQEGKTKKLFEANDENGLWSITGLAVDEERNRLWLATAATPLFSGFSPANRNRGSLIEFDLATLELLQRINMPVDGLNHELGGIAISEDGHVYVVDRATPLIFRKTPDGDRLEAFFASAELVALRDIAVTPDNSRVFVSDITLGVLAIDPVAQQAALVSGPENLNLGGLAGIEYMNGELFVVQSRIQPQRVTRLSLDSTGAQVTAINAMASALPEFDGPGFTTISNENLYYFANTGSQEPKAGAVVMSTPLDAGVNVAPPDMQSIENVIKSQPQN